MWLASILSTSELRFLCLKWGCLSCLTLALRTKGHSEVFTATLGVQQGVRVAAGSIKEPEALQSLNEEVGLKV